MFDFLDVLALSAVPLYGDDRTITSSASNFDCPRTAEIRTEILKKIRFFIRPNFLFEKTLSFFKKRLAICSKL